MASSPHSGSHADDAFPSFLETDPFPSSARSTRRDSSESGTTDGFSAAGTPTVPSVATFTGPAAESGLPPSRIPSSVGAAATTSRKTAQNPAVARRNISTLNSRSNNDAQRRLDPPITTHVPTLTAQGFARPMSSQKLQSQRAARSQPQAQSPLEGFREESADLQESIRRYSNASINTLRDRMPPTRNGDVPPLPSSRGTDGLYIEGLTTDSVFSDHSVAPLHRGQANSHANADFVAQRSTTAYSGQKSSRSFRNSWGLQSIRTSRQDHNLPSVTGQHEKLDSSPSSPHDEKQQHIQPPRRMTKARNYEYFAGNLIFFIQGRCLNTKAKPLNVATFILTSLPSGLFFGFSASWLWQNVSPALPIVFAYIYLVTISSFFHAALSDPGILPRNLHPHPINPAEDDPWTLGPPTTEWVMIRTYPSKRSPAVTDSENGSIAPGTATAMEVPTKFCKSCNIWRPPRAHHCRVCDACIETQDHHCVWLNNCVGRRNYRYFFSFVGFGSILALMLMAFSLLHVVLYGIRNDVGFAGSLTGRLQERMAFAMFIYAIIALPYPGSLWVYHMFLTSRGETTREYLNSHKFLPKDRHRPFSQASWLKNILIVILRPRTPSYMAFKSRYEEGDLRLGHVEPKKERRKNLRLRYSASREGTEKHEMTPIRQDNSPIHPPSGSLDGGRRLNHLVNNTPR